MSERSDGTDRGIRRTRRRDRLVGAGLTLLVLLVLAVAGLVAFAWWVSEPAGDAAPPAATPAPGSAGGSPAPPDDLVTGETWLGDLVLESGTLLTPETRLVDVRAVGSDLRSGPAGTVVGRLQVRATVPFDVVAADLGEGVEVRAADDGQAAVQREVLAGGRVFRIVATGTVEVVEGRLVVEPRAIDVGGPVFLSEAIADAARELVTIEQPVEGLPEGLVLQDVTVVETGFQADLTGEDVLLGGG